MTNAWFSGTPKTPGPYWTSAGEDEYELQRVWVTQDVVTDTDGDNTPRHMLRSSRLWHAWQTEPPAPPDRGPGVWTDRPFAGGPHRLSIPQGHTEYDTAMARVLEVNVLQSDEPWTSWTFLYPLDERACLMSAGNVLSGARWYRYPEPPVDVRARVRPEARGGA